MCQVYLIREVKGKGPYCRLVTCNKLIRQKNRSWWCIYVTLFFPSLLCDERSQNKDLKSLRELGTSCSKGRAPTVLILVPQYNSLSDHWPCNKNCTVTNTFECVPWHSWPNSWPPKESVLFPEFLLTSYQYLHIQEYAHLICYWCDTCQSSWHFLLGQSHLVLGEYHKALGYFLKAARGIGEWWGFLYFIFLLIIILLTVGHMASQWYGEYCTYSYENNRKYHISKWFSCQLKLFRQGCFK